jgi:hypothetical protein
MGDFASLVHIVRAFHKIREASAEWEQEAIDWCKAGLHEHDWNDIDWHSRQGLGASHPLVKTVAGLTGIDDRLVEQVAIATIFPNRAAVVLESLRQYMVYRKLDGQQPTKRKAG